jgi:hypothetical protein
MGTLTLAEHNENNRHSNYHETISMSNDAASGSQPDVDPLDAAADQAIAACGGDAREAVKALLVANEFLEREIDEKVSRGYLRGVRHGRFNTYSG